MSLFSILNNRFERIRISSVINYFHLKLLCKDPALRLGSGSINELRNHPFFTKIHWKNLELKKVEPPLKPHLNNSPNKEAGLDPWISSDGDDSNFEILSHSQQEVTFILSPFLILFYIYYVISILKAFRMWPPRSYHDRPHHQ